MAKHIGFVAAQKKAEHRNFTRKTKREQALQDEFYALIDEEAYVLAKIRGAITGRCWHVDHMIPLLAKRVSGLAVWNNIQVIPANMNLVKNNRLILTEPGEWISCLRRPWVLNRLVESAPEVL